MYKKMLLITSLLFMLIFVFIFIINEIENDLMKDNYIEIKEYSLIEIKNKHTPQYLLNSPYDYYEIIYLDNNTLNYINSKDDDIIIKISNESKLVSYSKIYPRMNNPYFKSLIEYEVFITNFSVIK